MEKDYRKKRDENLSVQRVQVRTAIDRWIQEALPSENQPMEQWKERATTKFEGKGLREGRAIHEFIWQRPEGDPHDQ